MGGLVLRKLTVFVGNPPMPIFMLWRKALSQSTEGIFFLFVLASVGAESAHNHALTYSWTDVTLAVITALQIRRYYKRHREIYLSVYENKFAQIKRYLEMPEYFKDSRVQEIARMAATAREGGQLSGFTASLASKSYIRLDDIAQRMTKAGAKKWYYLDTFILLCILGYAVSSIWLIAKNYL